MKNSNSSLAAAFPFRSLVSALRSVTGSGGGKAGRTSGGHLGHLLWFFSLSVALCTCV